MDNGQLNIMMHRPHKGPISELNSCITCGLCKGYFIDATTIIECLHTFCRSCIVKYLKSNKYCPICDVQVHKSKPLLNIRQDKTLQALVYKLVPRLYQDEAKRRKAFYEAHPTAKPSVSEEDMATKFDYILAPDESIDFTLNYDGSSIKPRYIRCSSAVSISHLKKLIHAKYELTDRHKVDVFFKDNNLDSSLTLIDVAYIHSWKRKTHLDLTFKIYECGAKKPKLECSESEDNATASTNWKEVQLRISENGEMSITGIQESGMLELLEATENFTIKSEVVINESKPSEASAGLTKGPELLDTVKKEIPDLRYIGKGPNCAKLAPVANSITEPNLTGAASSTTTTSSFKVPNAAYPKPVELSASLNLNSEISVMPISTSTNCVSLASCGGTTTVFSTISKSMCSTKSDDSHSAMNLSTDGKMSTNSIKTVPVNSVLKQSNSLKRKCDEPNKTTDIPAKLSKPTILNRSISLLNLSNSHPLKKHSKIVRSNGERRHAEPSSKSVPTTPIASEKSDSESTKPIVINKNLNYLQVNRFPKLNLLQKNVPCYMSKGPSSGVGKAHEKNGGKMVAEASQDKSEMLSTGPNSSSRPPNVHTHAHTPIITPAQLPHHQYLGILKPPHAEKASDDQTKAQNDFQAKSENASEKIADVEGTAAGQLAVDVAVSYSQASSIKTKPSTSIGYKTLRDPPKSWNSQINSQIARVNQNAKAQQLANAAAAASQCALGNGQGRAATDLKTVRPAKFFKGRNMPRYLGNPASGVKPMYQVQVSPEKDKEAGSNAKQEKSEIKKHSIVKIDPKTLKPISEKAPDTLNLSNLSSSSSLELSAPHHGEDLRSGSPASDLKINISSVSIFNPLKLQQNSPRNERKSPKSPHSPKIKSNSSTSAAASTTTTSSSSSTALSTLPLRQQRDKNSLTFTPSNPFIPNLGSPTLNPNQFLYPAGAYPSYDPRFMAACHSLWYTQRMAAAAAAGLVPPSLPHGFGLTLGATSSSSTIGQQSFNAGASPKYSTATRASNQSSSRSSNSKAVARKLKESAVVKNEKSLEVVLEKINQSKVKEMTDVKSALVRNGLPLQRPFSPAANEGSDRQGTAEVCSSKGNSMSSTNTKPAERGKKSDDKGAAALPTSGHPTDSVGTQPEERSKTPTKPNEPNNSTDPPLEHPAKIEEDRLHDSNPMRGEEIKAVDGSENGKSQETRVKSVKQHSENGVSVCRPETDVIDNRAVQNKEVGACGNPEKVCVPNETSGKERSAEVGNESNGGEKIGKV